jgi:REP element-mobilizing transposase RayT
MDDHVHALVCPGPQMTSTRFVQAWKSASSHIICGQSVRQAPLWQRDFYQRWIRHPGHLDLCASYILANPRRRWSAIAAYPWVLPAA